MRTNEKTLGETIYLNKKEKNSRGITLIALVVTIVVLLILAGVSVNTIFSNDGILNRARNAQNAADRGTQSDLNGINELNDFVNKQSGKNEEEEDNLIAYAEASKNADGTLAENAKYIDSESTKVTIPKGFRISSVTADENSDGEQTVSKGLVILDSQENEFVWIPVNYTATGELDADGLDSGFKDTFQRINSNYIEPYTDGGYNEEKADYIKMMLSVQKNKGFYIGRYETGTTSPRTNSTDSTSEIVIKRDMYPYIYVGWGNTMKDITAEVTYGGKLRGNGAVYIAQTMYPDTSKYTDKTNNTGVVSTLCYGVQWDAIMNFVNDDTHNVNSSDNWGNTCSSSWSVERTSAKYTDQTNVTTGNWTPITTRIEKASRESILLTTGASDNFKAKNIFDLTGNAQEWTMEASENTRIYRGSTYGMIGYYLPAASRFSTENGVAVSDETSGFRIALYL